MKTQCKRPRCTNVAKAKHGYCNEHAKLLAAADPYIPACRSRLALRLLQDAGLSQHAIGVAVGMKADTVAKILRGQKTVRRSTERKILAVTSHDSPVEPPTWPTIRRLQSLQAAGFEQSEIAAGTGYSQSTLSKIMSGKRTFVSPAVARAVAEFYGDHKTDPVRRPARAARGKPWPTPMWWENIDDPDEQPGVTACLDCHGELEPESTDPRCARCRTRIRNRENYQRRKLANKQR